MRCEPVRPQTLEGLRSRLLLCWRMGTPGAGADSETRWILNVPTEPERFERRDRADYDLDRFEREFLERLYSQRGREMLRGWEQGASKGAPGPLRKQGLARRATSFHRRQLRELARASEDGSCPIRKEPSLVSQM